MQKILQRTALAEVQAARRLSRRKDKFIRQERKSQREHGAYVHRDAVKDIKQARQARREDWELGPIAPRRDVGLRKATYGSISAMQLQSRELTIDEQLEANPTGGRYATLVDGDRVVILEGRDKGKIGKIVSVDKKRQECTVEGLNLVDIAVPQWMLKADPNDQRPVRTMEKPVSLTSVKLVFPLPDRATGVIRDVIVKKLITGPVFHDRHTGRKHWSRIIPGLDIVVPWPKVEPKEQKDNECDTLRKDVELKSFAPSLLRPPMPPSVIDELRNKYSVFRTRHDETYLAKKAEEEKEKNAKMMAAAEIRTPLKEANRRERKLRKGRGYGILSRMMLTRIGEVIQKRDQQTVVTSHFKEALVV